MSSDWIALVVILAVPAFLAFAGTILVLRRTTFTVLAGASLLLVAGFVPLLLAYAFVLGIAAALAGGVAAGVVRGRRGMAAAGWALAAAALVIVVAEPLLIFNVGEVQSAERYSRCAGDAAVTAINKSVAQGRGYPANMNEVAGFDGAYGDSCYVNKSVNWLYRVSVPASYTVGYWIDWHVTRHVCLRTDRSRGWTCGFEMWGPFKPGEVD